MLWRSCWRWLELLRFNRVPGGCADERISRWVLTTQTTQVPNAHLDSEKVELQGPNSAQQHHNTTIVTGLEALSCQGGIWPQRRSVGAGKGNVLSYWPSMGACVVLCKMLSATTFKREKEGGEREEDDHEFTLASSCAFPNVNLKMKGTAGQNEKYRGIKHTTVKGGEKKNPHSYLGSKKKTQQFCYSLRGRQHLPYAVASITQGDKPCGVQAALSVQFRWWGFLACIWLCARVC